MKLPTATKSTGKVTENPQKDDTQLTEDYIHREAVDIYAIQPLPPISPNASQIEKKDYDYKVKIRNIAQMIQDATNGYLKPINSVYVDRLLNIRGKKKPLAIFMKPVSSNISANGIFIYGTTRIKNNEALYLFIGPNYKGELVKTAEKILMQLSEESKCKNIFRINDTNSPVFQKMIHQMGGSQKTILNDAVYEDENKFEKKFFVEKLGIHRFGGSKMINLVSLNLNDIKENNALVIDPNDYVFYLFLDNIEPKNDKEKKSLIDAIEWMKSQPSFDKRELFIFGKEHAPYTVKLMIC